jgi:hypothetical protein
MPVAAEWEALSAFFGSSAIDQTLSCRLSPERVNDQSWQWRPPALQPARASTGAHAVFYRGRLLYFSLVTLTSVGCRAAAATAFQEPRRPWWPRGCHAGGKPHAAMSAFTVGPPSTSSHPTGARSCPAQSRSPVHSCSAVPHQPQPRAGRDRPAAVPDMRRHRAPAGQSGQQAVHRCLQHRRMIAELGGFGRSPRR